MSHKYTHENNQDGDSRNNFQKSQKKFIPKNQNSNPTSLSNSIKHSLPKQHDALASNSTTSVPGGSTSSRIWMGENGDWVPNTATSSSLSNGNFVNYLPQDEAVAAGLSVDDGGLDPVESQRVVDLLNRELSRLLKLSLGEFRTKLKECVNNEG
ncbi:hypothetical protein like AT1G27752 [Hibiscus trionum]|uniref:Uncharacterized protein n=1 Tax=Hibiscus trionum TaxID=183268 RepID=A0A9W7JCD8_HIBTR|nr:hypothetical protein like AT1G27752 [Hibiscus trionum]